MPFLSSLEGFMNFSRYMSLKVLGATKLQILVPKWASIKGSNFPSPLPFNDPSCVWNIWVGVDSRLKKVRGPASEKGIGEYLYNVFLSFSPSFLLSHLLGGGGGLVAKSCPTLVTPWTIACQAPLFLGFSRQEYWSGLPCPPSGHLPDPGIKSTSLMSLALAGRFFTTSATSEAICVYIYIKLMDTWIYIT